MSMPMTVETGGIRPTVKVGALGLGVALSPMVEPKLVRTVVDLSAHRPGMFELTFLDRDATLLEVAMIDIGSEVTVAVGDSISGTDLIAGEVTAIEGDYDHLVHYTVVRGYEQTHRLQKARRSRTFLDATDGEIAEKVAKDAGLTIGEVEDPGVSHRYVAQVAQTDWDFLKGRAAEIGYDVGVSDGEFYFKPAPGMSAGGLGGAAGAAASAASSALGLGNTLEFGENLRWLRPRVTSSGMVGESEVRVWDPETASVVSATASLESATADLEDTPASLATAHGGPLSLPALPKIPFLPSFLGASNDAVAIVDRPLGWGSVTQGAADAMAAGIAERVGSSFAEAEGCVMNAPGVVPGETVTLKNVPKRFEGDWYVTSAQHTFDDSEGYLVRFEVSGRHDRSLGGLVSGAQQNRRQRGLIDGLVPGIVTDNIDADGKMHRVKVALPWLSPDFVTDWARVVMPGVGETYGMIVVPEINDEVLVGFEFGDVRRAYVLGGLVNGNTEIELGGDAVKQGIPGGQVVKRGIVSRLGNKVLIDDDGTGGAVPPTKSGVTIGNKDDTVSIQFDDVGKKIIITCDAMTPSPASIEIKQNGAGGSILIEQAGTGGKIDVKSAGNVTVEAAAPGNLSLKGGTGVTIDGGAGLVELKGSMIKLN